MSPVLHFPLCLRAVCAYSHWTRSSLRAGTTASYFFLNVSLVPNTVPGILEVLNPHKLNE